MNFQDKKQFLLVQRITLLVNQYEYFLYDGTTQGEPIAFAQQKRFAFREHVTVWQSDSKESPLFTIKADKLLDVHGRFLIHDAQEQLVGFCRKAFGASLLRSTWEVCAPDGTVIFIAREQNQTIAAVRRIAQFLPILSEIASVIPFNFQFEKDGKLVGGHQRLWGSFNDRYVLSLTDELKDCDRRLPLALGILLDALQAR